MMTAPMTAQQLDLAARLATQLRVDPQYRRHRRGDTAGLGAASAWCSAAPPAVAWTQRSRPPARPYRLGTSASPVAESPGKPNSTSASAIMVCQRFSCSTVRRNDSTPR